MSQARMRKLGLTLGWGGLSLFCELHSFVRGEVDTGVLNAEPSPGPPPVGTNRAASGRGKTRP